MSYKNKLIVSVVGVVLVAGLYFVKGDWFKGAPTLEVKEEAQLEVSEQTIEPAKVFYSKKKVVVSPEVLRPYTDLVKEYWDQRIQFDERCQVPHDRVTYKNGTKVLLDNRSESPRVITFMGSHYSLQAFGYQVVTLSSQNLPQESLIGCGAANVSKVLVQI